MVEVFYLEKMLQWHVSEALSSASTHLGSQGAVQQYEHTDRPTKMAFLISVHTCSK